MYKASKRHYRLVLDTQGRRVELAYDPAREVYWGSDERVHTGLVFCGIVHPLVPVFMMNVLAFSKRRCL